jgi:hypothetical protein
MHQDEQCLGAIGSMPIGDFRYQEDVFGSFGKYDGVGPSGDCSGLKSASFPAECTEISGA